MSAIALVILALLWAAVLVPDFVQRSQERSRSDSIGSFARQLSTLSQTSPSSRTRPMVVRSEQFRHDTPARPAHRAARPAGVTPEVAKRRQDVVVGLISAALITFLGAVSVGGPMLAIHVVIDLMLVAYLGLLLFVTRKAQQRASVTVLYSRHDQAVMATAPRRQRVAR